MGSVNKSVSARAAAVWEDRWVRFRMALKVRGVEAGRHDYYRGWVLKWLGFIKPKSFRQGTEEDFRNFLMRMAGEGKKDWQLRQADEALRVFYQDVQPVAWAKNWPEEAVEEVDRLGGGGRRLATDGAAEVPRPPTEGRRTRDFLGREDTGELPGKYGDFGSRYSVVRGGKGDKDRRAPLPEVLAGELKGHMKG